MKRDKKENKDESEFPRDVCPSGQGTFFGYSVEARHNFPEPKEIAGQVFDNRWKSVNFIHSPIGVPNRSVSYFDAGVYGLLTYQAAQALRWWFHADIEANEGFGGVCMETRIVKHEIKYKFSVQAVSAHEHIGVGEGECSSITPRKRVK